MAAFAARRAKAKSSGLCARYVGDAIQGAGIRYTRTGSAKDTGPNLLRSGFGSVAAMW